MIIYDLTADEKAPGLDRQARSEMRGLKPMSSWPWQYMPSWKRIAAPYHKNR